MNRAGRPNSEAVAGIISCEGKGDEPALRRP